MIPLVPVLRELPFFAGVGDATLERLAARCVPRAVGASFGLFRAGDPCAGMYLVLDGRVRVYRTAPDGREQTLAVEGPGRPVAELPLFDGGPYPASAMTVVPSQLAFLPRAEFEHAFRSDPEVASAVVRALGLRLRHLVQLVETVAFRDVAARLAMNLADHADRTGVPGGDTVTLMRDRTQQQLATEVGTARASTPNSSRVNSMKSLRSSGSVLVHQILPAPFSRSSAQPSAVRYPIHRQNPVDVSAGMETGTTLPCIATP